MSAPGSAWQPVARLDDLELGAGYAVTFHGDPVLLVRTEQGVFAVDQRCPHAGGKLSPRLADETTAVCPKHGWAFDVTTGRCRAFKGQYVKRHRVCVHDGRVYLRRGWLRALLHR